MWKYRGQKRPSFAELPGPGQESVWDYPRPPTVDPDVRRVEVMQGGLIIADSWHAYRVLETASPPTFYIPAADVLVARLMPCAGQSFCEWKGMARYWALKAERDAQEAVGWSYPTINDAFKAIEGYFSFYPARVACFVGGERVQPQAGAFYGGWVTHELVGPFKGAPGTNHW